MLSSTDIHLLSRERLRELGLGDRAVDAFIELRSRRRLELLEELLRLPDVTPDLVEKLYLRGINVGPVEAPDAPPPARLLGLPPLGTGIPALVVMFDGLSKLFAGTSVLLQQAGGGKPDDSKKKPDEKQDAGGGIRIPAMDSYRERDVQLPDGSTNRILERLPCYCAKVWILVGGAGAGDGNGAHAHGKGAVGAGALRQPTQAAVDEVAGDLRMTNTIFEQCGVILCLCAVHVLDTRLVNVPDGSKTLSDALFDATGVLFGEGRPDDPLETLFHTLWNSYAAEFDHRCVHIFYVRDVQKSPGKPDTAARSTRGVGGYRHPGGRVRNPQYTPMGVVEGGSASTIAHEVVHGLGLGHAEDSTEQAVRDDANNLMREIPTGRNLIQSQRDAITGFLRQHVREGCP